MLVSVVQLQALVVVSLALYVFFVSPPFEAKSEYFWLHPFLFVLALCAQCLATALMTEKPRPFWKHLACASVSSMSTFLGAFLIYRTRTYAHFVTTWHGMIGLAAWVAYASFVQFAALFLWPLRLSKLRNARRWHRLAALFMITINALNILVGLGKVGLGIQASLASGVLNLGVVVMAVTAMSNSLK